ncbi:hydroxymethylglutaryl-CoA lyase [Pigmentiphaga soli]|uniref:Hydroxymethylglutaryl-CoA lyase n=1 Tax=Pigmentiphaga soli TaxID=1007095 RepID=A0ABP8H252_9BURK
MNDLPSRIHIKEEGPREGFQFEKAPIPTARKIELIDALSRVGIRQMQIVSFVNPKAVPGMADAEAVVAGITPVPGVSYKALWFNEAGLERAIAAGRIDVKGSISLSASDRFLQKNLNRTPSQQLATLHGMLHGYRERGIGLDRVTIMAAFGCNYEGDVRPDKVVGLVGQAIDVAAEHGLSIGSLSLADTMGWATPLAIKRTVGAIRARYPEVTLELHLHDTRGMGIANAYAGLEMGIDRFDASVAGLGGCPFAANAGAAGNVCTEDLVFMCEEMGIETGIDLEALIECARLAQDVVGHPLPGAVMVGGSLRRVRERIAQAAAA